MNFRSLSLKVTDCVERSPFALPARKYVMTLAVGIKLKFISETGLKRNSPMASVRNV
jgi:hypothetical protein